MYTGMTAGHGTLSYMQLKCRRENPYNHEVLAQARNLWPYGGPWGSTDEFRSKSPELLRLHHIAPLPSALPNLQAPLAPQLQPAFTAAQALRRVAVRAPIAIHTDLQHSCFLSILWHRLAAAVHWLAGTAGASRTDCCVRHSEPPCAEILIVQEREHYSL